MSRQQPFMAWTMNVLQEVCNTPLCMLLPMQGAINSSHKYNSFMPKNISTFAWLKDLNPPTPS